MDVATLTAAPFAALAESGGRVRIYVGPDDDSPAAEALVANIIENPRGTMPGTARTAFVVDLHLPPHFAQPYADVWVSAEGWQGRLGPLHIARVGLPSPEDVQRTLYQLTCN